MQDKFTSFLLGCLTALLVSCGGGGGGTLAEGGIGGTGISYGKAAALGSVTVNSTKFEFDSETVFTGDGNEFSSPDDLKVGLVLRVEGNFDTNIASRVEYEETVRGPVEDASVFISNPDNSAATMTILGQTVRTNSLTVFDNFALDPLNPAALEGQVVDVSGLREADGTIVASYIEIKTPTVDEYRINGVVSNLDTVNTVFNIDDLEVNYVSANLSDLPANAPEEGQFVRVKGASTDFTATPTALEASSVEPAIAPSPSSGDSMEIEGFITDFNSLSDFKVNGVFVDATGASVGALGNNVRVEVKGDVDAFNVLQAIEVEVEPVNSISIQATIDTTGPAPNSYLVFDTVLIQLNEATQLEDDTSAALPEFRLSDINIDDYIEVRGYLDGNTVVATKLDRDDPDIPDNRSHLQAPAENINRNDGSLQLLGVSISTDSETDYEDEFDDPMSKGDFFNALAEGDLVKAKWDPFTSTLSPVKELSLELEDD